MKKLFIIHFFAMLFTLNSNAATVEQTFDVEIGLFDAAKVVASYAFEGGDYLFSSTIQTTGLFDKFYTFKSDYMTFGQHDNDSFITRQYHQTMQSSAHLRTKSLIFDENGVLKARVSAKDGKSKMVEISHQTKSDAYDMQTVLAMLLDRFSKTGSCNLTKTVFNGKKIYHITVKDEGKTQIDDTKIPFKGEAYRCSLFIYQEKAEKGDLLWQSTAGRHISFYLAKEPQTQMPVLLKTEIASTPLGTLRAYTTNIDVRK